jgi:hypothetical protein
MEIFNFSPNSIVPETIPRENSNVISMGGWLFSARPTSPMQRKFRLRLHGLRWYLNGDDTYDESSNTSINARALEQFYEDHEMWNPFVFPHPHLGDIVCYFASPVTVPAAIPDGNGWLEPLEITLVEAGLPVPPIESSYIASLNFETASYWVDGSNYAVTNLPGYTYTRSNSVLYPDAADIDTFAADVVPRNSLGYHSYGLNTNPALHYNDLNNAAWVKSAATISNNAVTGPDGGSADKLIATATSARHFVWETGIIPATGIHTASAVAKAAGKNFISIGASNGAGVWSVVQFNLATGVVVNTSGVGGATAPTGYIYSLGNGWYRVIAVLPNNTGGIASGLTVMTSNGGDAVFEGYTGNGTDGIYVANAEILTGKTFLRGGPIIPTTTASVDNVADVFRLDHSGLSGEFTIWGKATVDLTAAVGQLWQVGLDNNTMIRGYRESDGHLMIQVSSGGTITYRGRMAVTPLVSGDVVLGVSRQGGTWRPFAKFGGIDYTTFTTIDGSPTAGVPLNLTRLWPGDNASGSSAWGGPVKYIHINPVGLDSTGITALLSTL